MHTKYFIIVEFLLCAIFILQVSSVLWDFNPFMPGDIQTSVMCTYGTCDNDLGI